MALNKVPRGATVRTDADGEYVAYHRVCNWLNCGVELTSRNRAPTGALRCIPCGLEAMREGAKASYSKPSTNASRRMEDHHVENPEGQKVHKLLTGFLCNPTVTSLKDALLSELVTYEIRKRMSHLR